MITEEERQIFYKCDPKKNYQCRKTACQSECFFTTHKEYAKDKKTYVYNTGIRAIERVKDDREKI